MVAAVALTYPVIAGLTLSLIRPRHIVASWLRNINHMCIGYSLRPRLSSRLTPGGRTFPGKPYPFGDPDSNRIYRYSSPDSHFPKVHRRSRFGFAPAGTLSYRSSEEKPTFSVPRLVPIIFGADSLDGSAVTLCLNGGCL